MAEAQPARIPCQSWTSPQKCANYWRTSTQLSQLATQPTWENGLAPDALVIGTHDVEWWHGKDRVLPVVRAQTEEMHSAGIRLTGGDPAIGTSEDSVWAADRPTMHACSLAQYEPDVVRNQRVARSTQGRTLLEPMAGQSCTICA